MSHKPVYSQTQGGWLNLTKCCFYYARKQNTSHVFAIVWASVRLSICLSHSWAVSKRCKLGSRNFHCGLPQGL